MFPEQLGILGIDINTCSRFICSPFVAEAKVHCTKPIFARFSSIIELINTGFEYTLEVCWLDVRSEVPKITLVVSISPLIGVFEWTFFLLWLVSHLVVTTLHNSWSGSHWLGGAQSFKIVDYRSFWLRLCSGWLRSLLVLHLNVSVTWFCSSSFRTRYFLPHFFFYHRLNEL